MGLDILSLWIKILSNSYLFTFPINLCMILCHVLNSVYSTHDLDWGILGDWVIGSIQDTINKELVCSCKNIYKYSEDIFLIMLFCFWNTSPSCISSLWERNISQFYTGCSWFDSLINQLTVDSKTFIYLR